MTDDEINSSVARKLGYELMLNVDSKLWIKTDTFNEAIPDYSHSIAAAWEIVESLTPCHGVFLKQSLQPPYGWTVTMWSPMTEEPDFMVHADTAPLAICSAFLKLP